MDPDDFTNEKKTWFQNPFSSKDKAKVEAERREREQREAREREERERKKAQRKLETIQKFKSKQESRAQQAWESQLEHEIFEKTQRELNSRRLEGMQYDSKTILDQADHQYQTTIKNVQQKDHYDTYQQRQKHAQEEDGARRLKKSLLQQEQARTIDLVDSIQQKTRKLEEESDIRQEKLNKEIRQVESLAEEKRQEFEKQMEELREQTRIELEKSRLMWEERRRQLDEQMKYFAQMMMARLWTQQLEQHFTSRLNFLRTSHREISRRYRIVVEALLLMKRRNESNKTMDIQVVRSKIDLLEEAIAAEKKLMRTEQSDLMNILSKRQWLFLESVNCRISDVIDSCNRFDQLLTTFNSTNVDDFIRELKVAHVDICSKCEAIPTFSSLRETFSQQNDWPSSSSSSSSYSAIEDVPSGFKIEEIE